MRRCDLRILERIFEAEINGRLPAQFKSRRLEKLHADGYIEPMTRTLGHDRFGAIEVSGWSLTHAGRITYCESCPDVSEMEN